MTIPQKWTQEDGTPGIVQRRSDNKTVSIPAEKLLILTHQQEGDNWEGVSILRSAYQNWYFKKTLYQIDAMKHERQALGVVRISVPTNATDQDKANVIRAAMNIRANEQAYVEVPQGYEIEFMDMKANTTADPTDAIAHHDRNILKAMQVQYIDIGSQGTSGSFAASSDQRRLLELQDQAIADQIVARINEKVVKTLIDLNFNVTNYPKWRVGRIAQENIQELTEAVSKMVTSKLLTPTAEDEEHARKLLHFPDMPDEVRERGSTSPEETDAKDTDAQPDKSETVDEDPDTHKLEVDKVEASAVLAHAREMKKLLTENLYGTSGFTSSNAA